MSARCRWEHDLQSNAVTLSSVSSLLQVLYCIKIIFIWNFHFLFNHIIECVVPTAYKIQRGKLDYTLVSFLAFFKIICLTLFYIRPSTSLDFNRFAMASTCIQRMVQAWRNTQQILKQLNSWRDLRMALKFSIVVLMVSKSLLITCFVAIKSSLFF